MQTDALRIKPKDRPARLYLKASETTKCILALLERSQGLIQRSLKYVDTRIAESQRPLWSHRTTGVGAVPATLPHLQVCSRDTRSSETNESGANTKPAMTNPLGRLKPSIRLRRDWCLDLRNLVILVKSLNFGASAYARKRSKNGGNTLRMSLIFI